VCANTVTPRRPSGGVNARWLPNTKIAYQCLICDQIIAVHKIHASRKFFGATNDTAIPMMVCNYHQLRAALIRSLNPLKQFGQSWLPARSAYFFHCSWESRYLSIRLICPRDTCDGKPHPLLRLKQALQRFTIGSCVSAVGAQNKAGEDRGRLGYWQQGPVDHTCGHEPPIINRPT